MPVRLADLVLAASLAAGGGEGRGGSPGLTDTGAPLASGGTLAGPTSAAAGINAGGWVAGTSDTGDGKQAFVWRDGTMTALGTWAATRRRRR